MITIDQLLESVDLYFEPRFVTKNKKGLVHIWKEEPVLYHDNGAWLTTSRIGCVYDNLKLSEFDGKPWQECIYEVPRKVETTDKIEKLERHIEMDNDSARSCPPSGEGFMHKINELVDAVNKHADIIQQIGDWGTRKGECLWCETLTKFEPNELKGAKNE